MKCKKKEVEAMSDNVISCILHCNVYGEGRGASWRPRQIGLDTPARLGDLAAGSPTSSLD